MAGQTQPAVRFVSNSLRLLDKKAKDIKFVRLKGVNKFAMFDCGE